MESLDARDIPYLQLTGMEEQALSDRLESTLPDKAAVIHLNILDRGAHRGAFKLVEMTALLESLLARELPALYRLCKNRKRALIVTTDHGFSLKADGLSHGSGGVYERAIFRAAWRY